jgi:hypothetical protein
MFKTMLQTTSEGCEIILYRSFGAAFYGAEVASTDFSSKDRQLASVNTPMQIEQTRIGLFDLRAELTTLRERGLSNRTQLRVTVRTCSMAT